MKIGSSSMTRRTGCSCAPQTRNNVSPWCRQLPASSPARIFTPKSNALTSSMFSLTQRFMSRDEARRDWANGMHGPRDVGDRVLGAGRSLDIDKKENPAVRFEPAPQFAEDAGLPHAPLPGQQHMIPVPNARFEYSQLGFAVEEVVTAYPATGGRSHGSSHSTNLMNSVSPTQSHCQQFG